MKYHISAFFFGFLLDLLLGDPYWLPHPIRLIGSLISGLEKKLLDRKTERNNKNELKGGVVLVFLVLTITLCVTAMLIFGTYYIHPCLGVLIETIMTYQILATKCLKVESMKVYHCLQSEGLESARKAVSMIVGRDTSVLDEEGVAKAAIETVAENTSDGVIAPMLYTALGGPIFGFFYKAVNTMDSMVGYKNEKYLYFGRAAAKLDDLVNYIPARISAYLMICAAFIGGKSFNGRQAYKIYKRDNRKHASPNSAQTESVCAGALGIRLAGDASYFGKIVKKPFIGDALRSVEYEDIKRINRLMYLTAWLCEMICLILMVVLICL
ncbi:MAG: cobalamin biosynthesis protein CobD [Lachnospiraceae bacterium]|nr:cobalamin biosynthesis protein CobD [Lachnospiraceae bacterium]MBQ8190112.1 cobalamin biosynthesis protein CobD [Lachnospiraceae bacterium]